MVEFISGAVDDLDFDDLAWAGERSSEAGMPHLFVNMVASVDGATAVNGRSSPLGEDGDRSLFLALRGVADVILVGADTVRAEQYRPPEPPSPRASLRRQESGKEPVARIAVVSGSLEFDVNAPWLAESDHPPVVFTTTHADRDRRRALETSAEVVGLGDDRADLSLALRWLRERGARDVLCEGGPNLNGYLFAADLVDEIDVTISPLIVGGRSSRLVDGPELSPPLGFRADRIVEVGPELLVRYLRDRQ